MTKKRQLSAEYYASLLLNNKPIPEFGALLAYLCHKMHLSQSDLEWLARKEYQLLQEKKLMDLSAHPGSMGRTVISRIMSGLQRPSPAQVYIWLEVMKSYYEILKAKGYEVDELSPQMQEDFSVLGVTSTPERMLQASSRVTMLLEQEKTTDVGMKIVPRLQRNTEPAIGTIRIVPEKQ